MACCFGEIGSAGAAAGFAAFGASSAFGRVGTTARVALAGLAAAGLAAVEVEVAVVVAVVGGFAVSSGFGVRTSVTPAVLADVCGRRAAFAWRAAVDFFAMLFSPVV
jgi:hypothetical protein